MDPWTHKTLLHQLTKQLQQKIPQYHIEQGIIYIYIYTHQDKPNKTTPLDRDQNEAITRTELENTDRTHRNCTTIAITDTGQLSIYNGKFHTIPLATPNLTDKIQELIEITHQT